MLIGGDDISYDIITLGKFKLAPVSPVFSNSRDVVASSPSFSRPTTRLPQRAYLQDKCNIVYSFLK